LSVACQDWVAIKRKTNSKYELVFSVQNERRASPREGKKWNRKGRRKGVSDWLVLCKSHCETYSAACIELKSPIGRVSKEQQEFMDIAWEHGNFCTVARSLDAFIACCEWYIEGVR